MMKIYSISLAVSDQSLTDKSIFEYFPSGMVEITI